MHTDVLTNTYIHTYIQKGITVKKRFWVFYDFGNFPLNLVIFCDSFGLFIWGGRFNI